MLGLLADGRIEHAATLGSQLESYCTRPAPRNALSDWKPAQHVDLAQALMLGCWWGERMLRPIAKQPPAPRIPVEPPRPPTFNEALA